jgi:hypothetical protein
MFGPRASESQSDFQKKIYPCSLYTYARSAFLRTSPSSSSRPDYTNRTTQSAQMSASVNASGLESQVLTYLSIRRPLIVNNAVFCSTEATSTHVARSALSARSAALEAIAVDAYCLYVDDRDVSVVSARQGGQDGMILCQAPCVYGPLSPPIPIRRHHHLAHETVLDAELGVYLYRWSLLDGRAAG